MPVTKGPVARLPCSSDSGLIFDDCEPSWAAVRQRYFTACLFHSPSTVLAAFWADSTGRDNAGSPLTNAHLARSGRLPWQVIFCRACCLSARDVTSDENLSPYQLPAENNLLL